MNIETAVHKVFIVKSIVELKNKIHKKITTENIVEAVIFKIYEMLIKTDTEVIPKSQAFLKEAFIKMKKKSHGLLRNFIFDESWLTHFCDELGSVLFRLEASPMLPTLNPTHINYTKINYRKFLEPSYKKLRSQKKEVDKCVEFFPDMIKT